MNKEELIDALAELVESKAFQEVKAKIAELKAPSLEVAEVFPHVNCMATGLHGVSVVVDRMKPKEAEEQV